LAIINEYEIQLVEGKGCKFYKNGMAYITTLGHTTFYISGAQEVQGLSL